MSDLRMAVWRGGGYGDAFYAIALMDALHRKYPSAEIDFLSMSYGWPFIDLFNARKDLSIKIVSSDFVSKIISNPTEYYDVYGCISPSCFLSFDPYSLSDSFYYNELMGMYNKQLKYFGRDFLINPIGACIKTATYSKGNVEASIVYKNVLDLDMNFSDAKTSITNSYGYKSAHDLINNFMKPKEYITFHQWAFCENGFSTKFWKYENWKKLAKMIKKEYDLPIVQIGALGEIPMGSPIQNFLGRTDFLQSCWIMENSALHVDIEGSLIHASYLLGNKSIALTGPSSLYWRHPDAQNIKYLTSTNSICDLMPCENKVSDWAFKCALKNHDCMNTIAPEVVFDAIKEMLSNE